MDVPLWVWGITVAAIIGMLVFDFYGHVRTPHAPTLKESGKWSAIYVAIAVLFGLVVLVFWGGTYAGEYFAGWVTEKSLSVDNLFVFVLIMASFAVPRELQQKVLLFGIAFALVLRTIFIFLGAAAIENFSWVFYIFGGFLIWTAIAQARSGGHDDDEEFKENSVLRLTRKVLPTTEEYHSDRLTTKINGKRFITPLMIALIAIGSADILFAVDSIPAIFGLTQETYLVFSANAFALLGLRQLFFLIDGLLDRLVYLAYGLAIILGFIGIKLLIHALHENTLPFINGGEHVTLVPEIPTWLSLLVILVTLLVTTWASLRKNKKDAQRREQRGAGDPAADSTGRHIDAPGDPDADTAEAPADPREVPVSRPESRTD
ncbi:MULTISPECIES: TerC family protein [unclassified Modestobacter]|uniref:TerC family protein n=1 Tax=unclassified Modestobacter TaxID=2643866 RepID=UPI0022AA4D1D|nr:MULTISPECIES: TerC family protein [unclassified Modestobacter]MCZ2814367.1 TerC family protein [Modestobacter sp. VKM Ac-2979]MCZ2843941.1 TerC family protein [Modestobacter sp. VKM Ac-2980]MCZ2850620.1 TerC family protein [Modestobacter sp. VKM Ac-2978]